MAKSLQQVMEALHSSGIECGVQSIREERWEAWLGNDATGRVAEEADLTLDQAAAWLDWKARALYADTEYGRTPAEPEAPEQIESVLKNREAHPSH